MPKIIFVHPAIRQYRKTLFELLNQELGVRFIFVEDYEHNLEFLKHTALKNQKSYKGGRFLFYSKGVSFRLLRDVFGDYDIWIASGLGHFSTHLAFPFVKLQRKKFVLFAEDWWFSKQFKSLLFKPFAKIIARNCDAIIAASTKTRDFFINLGARRERIFLAPNATDDCGTKTLDPHKFKGIQEKIPPGRTVILYLGRIVRYKGLDFLLAAFSRLEKERSDIFLLVVGDGDFKRECLSIAKDLDVHNILFLSAVSPEETAYYYKLADLYVLPARFLWEENVVAEAWGFGVNEALSCGVPVITTDATAASDLIENGANGFLIKAGDPNDLYDKIKKLVDNKKILKEFKERAKKTMANFTPGRQFEVIKQAINSII